MLSILIFWNFWNRRSLTSVMTSERSNLSIFYIWIEILNSFLQLTMKFKLWETKVNRLEKFPANLTSQRSFWPPWPPRGQTWNLTFFASCISKYMFFGSRISKMALVSCYGLPEAMYWPPWPPRGQNWNLTFFASCISKYMFFGSRTSKMALVSCYGPPEAIFWPPWPPRGQNWNLPFLHPVYQKGASTFLELIPPGALYPLK